MGVRISVRVTPRASRDSIEAGAGGVLLVRVTAPPDDGKANAAVARLVARSLGVPKTNVRVVSGATARTKVLEVEGVDEAGVARLLGGADS
jgi:uncharacterized protein